MTINGDFVNGLAVGLIAAGLLALVAVFWAMIAYQEKR